MHMTSRPPFFYILCLILAVFVGYLLGRIASVAALRDVPTTVREEAR